MNFRYILHSLTRLLLFKKSFERPDFSNIFRNITFYSNNYSNLTFDEKIMIHSMINLVN
jgi:hypothetical protein